ncbi:hypothetical protein HPP92_019630 [Vanilla planifolia]|uniref:Uncharacterized protein n=1 Tax=Vanilla planifolia TaxID=51239 RepID=A0A835Q795_VANPL|nr:hypothetical protein HPP92_019630 [Vanilla planifolia]
MERRPRAVFMAFGTKGDVYPLAAIAAVLVSDQKHYQVVFITHAEHQDLGTHLTANGAAYIPVSTPSVLSAHQFEITSDDPKTMSFAKCKKKMQTKHKQESLSAFEKAMGDQSIVKGDFVVINFFALEGWNLAELYQIQCVVASPYVVPYSAPSLFESCFKKEIPLLHKYFHETSANEVCWNDVLHWMWPLFTEEWGTWRNDCLHLSSLPFLDPVTNLPMWHTRCKSPLLLYGFSKEIVECPGYWPSNSHACGFWFLPLDWQFSCSQCRERFSSISFKYSMKINVLCENHAELHNFCINASSSCLPIFVGLSSTGSMGFIRNTEAFLSVLKAVIKTTSHRFVLFSAGYEPLDTVIEMISGASSSSNLSKQECSKGCTLLLMTSSFVFLALFHISGFFQDVLLHFIMAEVDQLLLHFMLVSLRFSFTESLTLYLIICPFILDQFYWAERLYWLGVAPHPLERQYVVPESNDAASIKKASDMLSKAISLALSPPIKKQALEIAEKVSVEGGVTEALKVLKEQVIFAAGDGN